jgi:hypothetical protein
MESSSSLNCLFECNFIASYTQPFYGFLRAQEALTQMDQIHVIQLNPIHIIRICFPFRRAGLHSGNGKIRLPIEDALIFLCFLFFLSQSYAVTLQPLPVTFFQNCNWKYSCRSL